MRLDEVLGQDRAIARLRPLIDRGRLPHALLFCGPPGVGKRTTALALAATLLCRRADPRHPDPCERCPDCIQVAAQTHPDLILIQRPRDKNVIPIEKFIGDESHRMQEGLCHDLSLRPFAGGRKIGIVDDADFINAEGANALLKTLEEPPAGSVLILIGTSPYKQLPTIRSRCQLVPFAPLPIDAVQQILCARQRADSEATARRAAELSAGSVERAMRMMDAGEVEWRGQWLNQLATLDPGQNDFAKAILARTEGAGADAAVRRDALRQVCEVALDFYRGVLLRLSGVEGVWDEALRAAIDRATRGETIDPSRAARCIARLNDAFQEIAANVNSPLLIDCLLADLSRLSRGQWVAQAYA